MNLAYIDIGEKDRKGLGREVDCGSDIGGQIIMIPSLMVQIQYPLILDEEGRKVQWPVL